MAKSTVAALLALIVVSCTSAFTFPFPTPTFSRTSGGTRVEGEERRHGLSRRCPGSLCAEPAPKQEGGGDNDSDEGLDLNLEEMFEMFDAADQDEDFDETVKKVKGEDGS